jgi:ABC-type transport system involved in cytochrome c biogenesis permease subunit
MKKLIPFLVLVLALGFVGNKLRAPKNPGEFDVVGFGRLPVLVNGRLKPLDTVARTGLRQIQGREAFVTPDNRQPQPIEWFLDVAFRPDLADSYQVIEIVNPDVLAIFKFKAEDGRDKKWFSYTQLAPNLTELERQAKIVNDVDSAARTSYQRGVAQLYAHLVHYQQLKHALVSPDRPDFLHDLLKFQEQVGAGVAAVRAKQAGQAHDEAAVKAITDIGERFVDMANTSGGLLVVPPEDSESDPTAWKSAGAALLETFQSGRVNTANFAYAGFADAWRNHKPEQFNQLLELYRKDLTPRFAATMKKTTLETRFNAADLFTSSFTLYAFAFFAALFSWMVWPEALARCAFWLVGVAWLTTTAGILTRMWLEGRPPVTNLYSSALFVGWGSVALCLGLEFFYRNALATAAAGLVGFGTLMIADRLHLSGDTLEMMRAVLDSNFWLATHVVVVASGYSATCLAGFLALIYVFRGVFTTTLDKATADALARMVYGVVCFATLFSFVGTILGGIWADQSWGRFWGWDPKENGALLIVIWNAIILHARWGGLVKQRGLMCLAIVGNVVFAWSWFGTNMLGVGLHSYGFTDSAFWALVLFALSQAGVILLANLPLEKWRSFRAPAENRSLKGQAQPSAVTPP